MLFGPAEQANIEGFNWFTSNVSPYIKLKTVVAGKEFNKGLIDNTDVDVRGYVENLSELYAEAACVCIPLLRGGGMKVKTVEALMYGKTVFGTTEAFVGYDLDFDRVGGKYDTADAFIVAINKFYDTLVSNYNEYSREVFLESYSGTAVEKKVKQILSVCE